MLRRLAVCLVLLSPLASASDPAVDALKARFAPQEQLLLTGVLADPAAAAEFAKDAQNGGAAVMTKWYGRIAAFSSDYLARQHGYNDDAALKKNSKGQPSGVKFMAEPVEWLMLKEAMHKLEKGGILDQGKLKVFISMIDEANADLARGDTEAGHKVVDTGRKELVDALKEFLASPAGKSGLAEAARQRQEEEARKKAPPVVVAPPNNSTVPPVKKPPTSDVPVPPGLGDDEQAEQAREQAEKIRQELANGGTGSGGYAGDRSKGGGETPPVVVPGGDSASDKTGLSHSGGAGNLKADLKEPLKPDAKSDDSDDMDELHKMKEGVKSHKTLYATIGGGILGGLIGMIFGPIGIIIGAVAGAAAGAYGGNRLGKKLWG